MGKALDLTGLVVNSLEVIEKAEKDKNSNWLWWCKCECGKKIKVQSSVLNKGRIKSCGCKNTVGKIKHGMHGTKVYQTWLGMRKRCNNPNSEDYQWYGGKGITVDPAWDDFLVFLEDMGHPPTDAHTLDRIETDGNYCKDNCRWVTWSDQFNNRSTTVILEYNGKSQSITQWARELGVNRFSLRNRINSYGWSVEKALTTPFRDRGW